MALKEDWEVFTTDEDWKECWLEQEDDEVYKIAEKIGGKVVLCYYFENPVEYPSSSDGEFIGFLIRKDGKYLDWSDCAGGCHLISSHPKCRMGEVSGKF